MNGKVVLVGLGAAILRFYLPCWGFYDRMKPDSQQNETLNEIPMYLLPMFVVALVCFCIMMYSYGKVSFKKTFVALLAGAFLGEAIWMGYYLIIIRENNPLAIDITVSAIYMIGGTVLSFVAIIIAALIARALPDRNQHRVPERM